ncbi:MAG: hypothetical protein KatS3mg061_3452 [Dehalococcoidia bacterium]|nr:MAG: hypothetical protein KatS3mg061_3452 [Dehalococcoidia bacterium]
MVGSLPVAATGPRPPQGAPAAGTTFTYQGQLNAGATPFTGSCDFVFSLHDAPATGNRVGSLVVRSGVEVVNGLFTTSLDFGPEAFNGDKRWVETSVKCGAETTFTTLTPRQPLTAVPYALFALNLPAQYYYGTSWTGSAVKGLAVSTNSPASDAAALYGVFESASGVLAPPETRGRGVWGDSFSGVGVLGSSGQNDGVAGIAAASGKSGVFGYNVSGPGVTGKSGGGDGIVGFSQTAGKSGVYGENTLGAGVTGSSQSGDGVAGFSNGAGKSGVFGANPVAGGGRGDRPEPGRDRRVRHQRPGRRDRGGVAGASGKNGVYGQNTQPGGVGLSGYGPAGVGTLGRSETGAGVAGFSKSGAGVQAFSESGNLIEGFAAGERRVFYISANGSVFASGSFNCGLPANCFNAGSGADLAERIPASEPLQPGEVVEIDPSTPGRFRRVRTARSPLVVGGHLDGSCHHHERPAGRWPAAPCPGRNGASAG